MDTTTRESLMDMTSDDLCRQYERLKAQRREVVRANKPAEAVLAVENELRRVGNQLRRRGL